MRETKSEPSTVGRVLPVSAVRPLQHGACPNVTGPKTKRGDMSTQPGDTPDSVPIDPETLELLAGQDIDIAPYHEVIIRHGYAPGRLLEYGRSEIKQDGGFIRHVANLGYSLQHPGHLAITIRRKYYKFIDVTWLFINIKWQSDEDASDPLTPELLDAVLTILDAHESKGDGQLSSIQDHRNDIILFLNETCSNVQNHITPCANVYEAYAEWATKYGFNPPASRTQLEDVLTALGFKIWKDGPRSYLKGCMVNDPTFPCSNEGSGWEHLKQS